MDSAGTVTTVRTLPTSTKKVRFSQNLNEIRYVDGLETIHKLTYSLGMDRQRSNYRGLADRDYAQYHAYKHHEWCSR